MQNIAIITLLLLPYWLLTLAHAPEVFCGRVGIALVFAFTGVGHFIKTSAMTQMLPASLNGSSSLSQPSLSISASLTRISCRSSFDAAEVVHHDFTS